MAKQENEQTEKENGTKERKQYELTRQAKESVYVGEIVTRKFKKTTAVLLELDLGFKKECRLEPDEKAFVVLNGTYEKYDAKFCEGISQEGVPYLGMDIWFDAEYRKRVWFTPLEKIMLARQGLLQEVR